MPAGPSHIYFFLDEQNRSVYIDNGILAFSSSPKPLQFTPDGWKEISIVDQRNINQWSLDVDFTIPLTFVMDGAQILKIWFSTKGTEVPIYLVIMEQRLFYDSSTVPATYYYYYTLFYKSQVAFANYSHQGARVSVNMLDQSFPLQLKNNASKTFQFNLSDSHLPAPIYWDGIQLKQTGNFEIIDGVHIPADNIPAESAYNFIVPMAYLNSEGESTGISFQDQAFNTADIADLANSSNWFAKSNSQALGPITITPQGPISFTCVNNQSGHGTFQMRYMSSLGQFILITPTPVVLTTGQSYTINLNIPVTLQVGEALFLVGEVIVNGLIHELVNIEFNPGSLIGISYVNRFKPTLVKAFDIFEVFSLLISSMTGGTFVAAPSAMLSRVGLKIAITSGDGIRGIAAAILKITWNNFWSFVNMYEDAGMYVIGNQVHLERKEDCTDFTSFIDIGQISGLGVSPNNDLKFNLLKIGYPSQDYGETNGKDEFNTTLEMSVAVTSVSTELDYISDVRGDGFGGEYIRTGLDGKDTTDNTADGSPFAIQIVDNPSTVTVEGMPQQAYLLDRTLNPYASGLIFPATVFNLKLSPKQCLYRKGNYLLSCLNMLEHLQLTFNTLDKNQALQVIPPTGRPVIENANETIGDLGIPYFKPVTYDCTGLATSDILQRRKQNPRAAIRFSIGEITYTCLPLKEGIQPATNAAQAYQFLAGPDNDITQLNNYYGD